MEPHVPDFPFESPEDSAHHRLKAEHEGLVMAVQRERDTLSALIESITDEVWFADADGNVTLVNPAVWREFGALGGEPIETIATRLEVFRADGTPRPPKEAPLLRALHGETIRDEEETIRTPATGELRRRFVSGAPVRDLDGAIIGSVCVVRDVTARKRAEEALQDSEERLRSATAAARIGAFDWNIQTGVNRWTEELEAMYGLAPGEFGETQPAWEHLVHPDDRAPAVALVDGALESGQPVEGEWRVVWPDGSVHWISGRFQAYKDDQGRPLRLTGVNIDITRQKALEEELRRSRKDFDRAQAVGQVGSWRLDVRENVLTWSDENHRIFGLPVGTPLAYETFLSVVHPEDRAFVDARWQAALGGEPYDIEHRLLVEGQVKWVREAAFLEYDDAGELLGGFGITQDVTKRRRAEEALREQEERYRLIVTSLRDSISIQDRHLRYEWVINPALNLTVEDFIGKTDEDLVDPEQFEAVRALKEHVMQSGEDLEVEVPLTDAHGRVTLWEGRYAPRRDDRGEVTGVYSYFKDVTERKQAEAALRASEERFRVLFEGHGAVMLLMEPDSGQILDANAAAVRFYGYSREQLRAMRIEQINQLPPEEVAAERRRAAEHGKDMFTFPHRLASGEVRIVEVYSTAVTIQGRPTLFSIIHDVTARKQAEEALEQTRDMLAEAQEIAHLGSFEYVAATQTTLWSDEEFHIYGLDPAGPSPAYDVMLAECIHPGRSRLAARGLHRRRCRPARSTSSSTGSCGPTAACAGCTTARARISTTTATSSATSAPRRTSPSASSQSRSYGRATRSARRIGSGRASPATCTTRSRRRSSRPLSRRRHCGGWRSRSAGSLADDVRRLNRGALAQMRTLLLELRGDPLAEVPIRQLLQNAVEATESRAGVKVSLKLNEAAPLPPDVHEAVYRITQEALNNVVRHAKASNAWVQLDIQASSARLADRRRRLRLRPHLRRPEPLRAEVHEGALRRLGRAAHAQERPL